MDDASLRKIAAQLGCPNGEAGSTIAEQMNVGNAFITERSIEMLNSKPEEWIAEIGPGNGALSIPIVASIGNNGHFIGLERSDDMAGQASRTLGEIGPAQVTIHKGDCMNAPIDAATIDGVLAVNVLYFIDDLDALFTKISGWLKTGSRAVFGLRSAKSLEGMPFTRFGFHIRSLEKITEALQTNGFADVQSAYFEEGTASLGDLEFLVDSLIIKAVAK